MSTDIVNKKARLEYDILDEIEAGIALAGYEAKALRAGKATLAGARVVVRGGEAYLIGATISPYQEGNVPKSYDPERARKLLFSRSQLAELGGAETQRGLTIVPIMVYNKKRFIKLLCGVARKKKKHDKRATLKERDERRDIERSLKNQ